jgi:hypothetical protein
MSLTRRNNAIRTAADSNAAPVFRERYAAAFRTRLRLNDRRWQENA